MPIQSPTNPLLELTKIFFGPRTKNEEVRERTGGYWIVLRRAELSGWNRPVGVSESDAIKEQLMGVEPMPPAHGPLWLVNVIQVYFMISSPHFLKNIGCFVVLVFAGLEGVAAMGLVEEDFS